MPFCSGGCRSSSRQNSPGRSLGRRHSSTSEGNKPGALRISKGSPQLGEGEGRRAPPQLRGRQAKAPSAATSKGARRGPPALHLSRGVATQPGGGQACPSLPRPSPSQPHPLPARREAAPTMPGAALGSSPQQPPSPGCPRLSPPPPSSQPFRFLHRGHAQAPPEAILHRRED